MDNGQRKKLATQLLHVLRDPESTSIARAVLCTQDTGSSASAGAAAHPEIGKQKRTHKPIETWIALWAVVVALILFLAPKTPPIVGGCAFALFALTIHPVWNFWWIEGALWRRLAALAVVWAGLAGIVVSTIHFDSHERLAMKADPISGGILNPLTTMFTVTNGGGFPFSRYDIYCSVADVEFEGIDITTDKPGVFTVRSPHGADVRLDAFGGSDTVPCLQDYPHPKQLRFQCADIQVVIDYRIKWIPLRMYSRKWRLVTVRNGSQFDWIEKNINDPKLYCYHLE